MVSRDRTRVRIPG